MKRKNKPPNPLTAAILLLPAFLYRAGFIVFRLLTRSRKADHPVVSIGNIAAGGTGKTPAVINLIELVKDRRNAAVLTRGYGRRTKGIHIASADDRAADIGDEAVMIKRRYPSVNIVIGSDRLESARTAVGMGCDMLILDDGFQSFELKRDLDIVMIDSTFPLAGGMLLPAGRLREPMSSLKRADGIILHRYKLGRQDMLDGLKDRIRSINPHIRIFHSNEEIDCFVSLETGRMEDSSYFANKEIICFSGIGNPAGFYYLLNKSNAVIIDKIEKRDHYSWNEEDLASITKSVSASGASAVTTEKDAARIDIKLRDAWEMRIKIQIEQEEEFKDFINEKVF